MDEEGMKFSCKKGNDCVKVDDYGNSRSFFRLFEYLFYTNLL